MTCESQDTCVDKDTWPIMAFAAVNHCWRCGAQADHRQDHGAVPARRYRDAVRRGLACWRQARLLQLEHQRSRQMCRIHEGVSRAIFASLVFFLAHRICKSAALVKMVMPSPELQMKHRMPIFSTGIGPSSIVSARPEVMIDLCLAASMFRF